MAADAEHSQELEARRSRVPVFVTYVAAGFLFVGGALLMLLFMYQEQYEQAEKVFYTILPVSSGIISYWFATRGSSQSSKTK